MKITTEYLIEKAALEQAVLRYCEAVDKLTDLDFMMENFTDDAVLDLTGLQLSRYQGHDQIRKFYEGVFEDMSHHMHVLSNFQVKELSADTARIYAYIGGLGHSTSGIDVHVYVYYDLNLRKVDGTWKISHFYEAPKLPMPDSVTAVHKKN